MSSIPDPIAATFIDVFPGGKQDRSLDQHLSLNQRVTQ